MRKETEMKTRRKIGGLVGIIILVALEGFVIGAIIGQLPINIGIRLAIAVGLSALAGYITGRVLAPLCLP